MVRQEEYVACYRSILADARFDSQVVSKFVNCMMVDGKKSVALRVFYDCLEILAVKSPGVESIDVFLGAVDNVKPHVEVRSKRVGGATYQVPSPVAPRRRQTLAIRWILEVCRVKSGKSMSDRLADELLAAFRREGAAMTKRDNVHRMADANRAFSHFA